ncbi:MAG: FAD-dependent monooxygenase, partial [Micropepsaceae bacterium]
MLRLTEVKLPLDHTDEDLRAAVLKRLRLGAADGAELSVYRRAVDARKPKAIVFIYTVDVAVKDEAMVLKRVQGERHVAVAPDTGYRVRQVATPPRLRPVVIGAGPCGLFAALILAQMGLRPLILERGKVVRERTKDTFGFWRRRALNPESNAQFGEGGAGTFSDGKLYSQVKDPRFLGRKVLSEFVKAGAPPEILYVSKPHIGTFRLVTV